MSDPSVCFGCSCVRKVALERKWSPPVSGAVNASALRTSVLLMIVRCSRSGSSGRMLVGLRSNSLPGAAGDQRFLVIPTFVAPADPCTISMAVRRVGLEADVCAHNVWAGTMASSSGSVREAPMPRRTVRRERCFLVMYIASVS